MVAEVSLYSRGIMAAEVSGIMVAEVSWYHGSRGIMVAEVS